jgi:hypothetical protein
MIRFAALSLLAALWLSFAGPASAEDVLEATVCQLQSDPVAYSHKLVKISGAVSRGFEDFTLSDAACTKTKIWLELGGVTGSQTIYCCGQSAERNRKEPLSVEGIETSLIRDDAFERFELLTHGSPRLYGKARVTLIARYFPGNLGSTGPSKEERWGGYGHFGMHTLLVIQQVLAVDPP